MQQISRRSFLAGTALIAGGWAFLPANARAAAKSDPNRFLLMADIHVSADPAEVNHGCNPDDTFQQAVKDILELTPRPARLIVAGDCAIHRGLREDYERLKEFLRPLQDAGIAIFLALGNHDKREPFREAFPDAAIVNGASLRDRLSAVIETEHANWFLLHSIEEDDSPHGLFGGEQLKWLAGELDKNPSKPALLVAHHPLKNTEPLLETVNPRGQVKCYFYGHLHIWHLQQQQDGLHRVSLPATAWLFNEKQPRGFVDAYLSKRKIKLTLHCLNREDPRHGEKHSLRWRS